MPAALAVSGLVKRYGAVEALGGVDLEVREGELVGLLGPNGAGKSTLVKIAVGLVRPTAGQAELAGAVAGSLAARRALGSLATLVITIVLTGLVLFFLIQSFGDQALHVAAFLAFLVLTPLFFLGAALLYVDQAARAPRAVS